jgi:hypothetical protein
VSRFEIREPRHLGPSGPTTVRLDGLAAGCYGAAHPGEDHGVVVLSFSPGPTPSARLHNRRGSDLHREEGPNIYTSDGCTNGKVYVDRMGRMDRAVYEFELKNLDQFYTVLKDRYANLGPDGQRLVDSLNEHALEGARELYEVIE